MPASAETSTFQQKVPPSQCDIVLVELRTSDRETQKVLLTNLCEEAKSVSLYRLKSSDFDYLLIGDLPKSLLAYLMHQTQLYAVWRYLGERLLYKGLLRPSWLEIHPNKTDMVEWKSTKAKSFFGAITQKVDVDEIVCTKIEAAGCYTGFSRWELYKLKPTLDRTVGEFVNKPLRRTIGGFLATFVTNQKSPRSDSLLSNLKQLLAKTDRILTFEMELLVESTDVIDLSSLAVASNDGSLPKAINNQAVASKPVFYSLFEHIEANTPAERDVKLNLDSSFFIFGKPRCGKTPLISTILDGFCKDGLFSNDSSSVTTFDALIINYKNLGVCKGIYPFEDKATAKNLSNSQRTFLCKKPASIYEQSYSQLGRFTYTEIYPEDSDQLAPCFALETLVSGWLSKEDRPKNHGLIVVIDEFSNVISNLKNSNPSVVDAARSVLQFLTKATDQWKGLGIRFVVVMQELYNLKECSNQAKEEGGFDLRNLIRDCTTVVGWQSANAAYEYAWLISPFAADHEESMRRLEVSDLDLLTEIVDRQPNPDSATRIGPFILVPKDSFKASAYPVPCHIPRTIKEEPSGSDAEWLE